MEKKNGGSHSVPLYIPYAWLGQSGHPESSGGGMNIMLPERGIWRVLGDLAMLFVTSTFLLGYISLVSGLSFAVILSFISTNNKFYNKNFILKNLKYILFRMIVYIIYVVVIWFTYNYGLKVMLYGLWTGIMYAIVFVYLHNRISKLENEVSK